MKRTFFTGADPDIGRTQSVRDGLAALRVSLVGERQALITQELALYTTCSGPRHRITVHLETGTPQ